MNIIRWHTVIIGFFFLLVLTGLATLLFSRSTYAKTKSIPYAFVYGVGVVGWLASLAYAKYQADVFLTHRFSFSAVYFVTFGMLGLALTFPNNALSTPVKRLLALNVSIGALFSGLIFWTDYVLAPANFSSAITAPFSLLGRLYLLLLTANILLAVFIFVRRYLAEVRNRLYFNYIVLAFILLFLIGITTNLILPLAGVVAFAIVGPVCALLPFVAVVYALGITDIDEVGYVVAQLLQAGARLVLLAAFFAAGWLVHYAWNVEYFSLLWIIIMAIVAGSGVLCFYLFGGALDRYIEDTIAYSRLSPEKTRAKLMAGLSGEIELGQNATLVLKLIKQTIGVRAAGIMLLAKDGTFWASGDTLLSKESLPEVLKAMSTLPAKHPSDQLANTSLLPIEIRQSLEAKKVHALKPIHTQSGVKGLYLLGEKYSQEVFTKQDAALMYAITEIADLSIERALFYNQIQSFNETLQQRVDDATKRLRNANRRLKTLDTMKDDFISMASHQLRSPATSVHEAIQMLAQDYVPQADRAKIIELAEASSERLVGVITDMLSIARIQAGHFTLEKTYVNMTELANRAILEASGLAKQKSVMLAFQPPEAPLELRADRAKLNEIMSNYIENAIKYSEEGSTVVIALLGDGGKARFEVRDSGIGVPEDERGDLFKKFYRATNARKEQPNGNGIGLFVVKTVAEAHGGEAYFKPLKPGSLFGFWLPL